MNKIDNAEIMKELLNIAPFFLQNQITKIKTYYDKAVDTLHIDMNGSDAPDEVKLMENGDVIFKYKNHKLVGIIMQHYLQKSGNLVK